MSRASKRIISGLNIVATAVCPFLSVGCLMMFNGSDQRVGITSNPSGAKVTVDGNRTYTTPADVPMLRNANHTLDFEKDGYQPATQSLTSSLNGMFSLDVLLWGPLAFFDFANGSAYKLSSENLSVTLVPKPAVLNAASAETNPPKNVGDVPATSPSPASTATPLGSPQP